MRLCCLCFHPEALPCLKFIQMVKSLATPVGWFFSLEYVIDVVV